MHQCCSFSELIERALAIGDKYSLGQSRPPVALLHKDQAAVRAVHDDLRSVLLLDRKGETARPDWASLAES
jgi:hypothetical protein